MGVSLVRGYGGYASGTIAHFEKSTEDALVAQGYGSATTSKPTAGAVTTDRLEGKAAVAAGASSVVITHAGVNASSKITAQVSQSSADATATNVVRVTPATGSFTITVNAAATADTEVMWKIHALNVA